jgi:uncharacterized membrane protein YphA (DoxX/SURF4 family)
VTAMDNPVSDVLDFLTKPAWYTAVFWLLLIASAAIAATCWATLPEQRQPRYVAQWLFRLLIGVMWWQQTLWKLPPEYTDQPGKPFGATGLAHWMQTLGKSAAIPLQADFVNQIVLPHFYLFAPVVYVLELLTGVSLIVGAFVPLLGIIGALQILNIWLGLYNAWGEWPWTYFFLLVLQLMFAVDRYGRNLGVDALLAARAGGNRLLGWIS